MHWGKANLLSIRTTADQKGQKQAISTGTEKPHLIFSGKFLEYSTITHTNHAFKISLLLTLVLLQKVLLVEIFTATGGNPEMHEIYL
jgi:hypothetical protein